MLRRLYPFLLLIIGLCLGVLALEACFRLLPVNRGLVRIDPPTRWPLENYRPHMPYSYSRNWSLTDPQRGRSNNYGHLSEFDFKPGEEIIAVIGDSYIEARMNRYQDTIQAQLGTLLSPKTKVYGLGSNGLSIADYLVLSQQAAKEFKPRAFVYVIVDNDLSEAIVRRKGWHYFLPSDPEWPVYVPEREGRRSWHNDFLAASSLYRYLKGNLGLTFDLASISHQTPKLKSAITPPSDPMTKELRAMMRFVDKLPEVTGLPGPCHIFLLDTDRYAIYDQQQKSKPIDAPELKEKFVAEARSRNLNVIDLFPLFVADYAKKHKKFDFHPIDRHWNWRGHHIAALAAQSALADISSKCPSQDSITAALFKPEINESSQ